MKTTSLLKPSLTSWLLIPLLLVVLNDIPIGRYTMSTQLWDDGEALLSGIAQFDIRLMP